MTGACLSRTVIAKDRSWHLCDIARMLHGFRSWHITDASSMDGDFRFRGLSGHQKGLCDFRL
jgi:hypothetical protein